MYSTRSHSPAARATDAAVVIVAHGSPSEPGPQETFVRALATSVAELTGGIVRGATLAAEGSLQAAVDGLEDPLIFPHFMSDGWFVSTQLQNRLRQTGLLRWQMLPPLGLTPGLAELASGVLTAELAEQGLTAGDMTLIVAAHGSPSDPRPARATQAFCDRLERHCRLRDVRAGFVDQDPSIRDAARVTGPAIVLPFFAARAGHVLLDLPDHLSDARFDGPVLEPIGTWGAIARLIERAVATQQKTDAA